MNTCGAMGNMAAYRPEVLFRGRMVSSDGWSKTEGVMASWFS